jgi:hypothetical protein
MCLTCSYQQWFETIIAIAFQLCFKICHKNGSGKSVDLKLKGTNLFLVYADDKIMDERVNTMKKKDRKL